MSQPIRTYAIILLILCLKVGAKPCSSQAMGKAKNNLKSFVFKDMEEKLVSYPLGAEKNLLLVYFRTDCDECRFNAHYLKENASSYLCDLWLVSREPIEVLQLFEDMLGFDELDNIQILQDHQEAINSSFEFQFLPFVVFYDKNGEELEHFDHLPSFQQINELTAR